MSEDDLTYFLAVAGHHSIARAAQAIGVSQPALSRAVQRLERRFGTPLVERTSRGVALTDGGRLLAERARRASLEIQAAAQALDDLACSRRGDVRIAVGHTLSGFVNEVLVPRLHLDRPACTLRLDAHFNDQILRHLQDGDYDFAVSVLPVALPAGLACEALLHDQLVPAVHHAHPLARLAHPTAADLVSHPWVGAATRVLSREALNQLFTEAGVPPPRHVVETNSYETAMTAVRNAQYVAFAPRWLLRLGRGMFTDLVALEVPGIAHARTLGLLWREGAHRSPIALRAGDLVRAALQETAQRNGAGCLSVRQPAA